jgi:ribosome-associated translation inhibitor RaiA
VEKNQEIEVVMSVKGTTIRIKETSQDMYAPENKNVN